ARKGNLIAAFGMGLAIFATIFLYRNPDTNVELDNYGWIFSGLLIGTLIGTMVAKKVKMTAMPEMVSMFHGMGGACAMLISVVEFNHISAQLASEGNKGILFIIILGLIIGTVSFAGSMVAWGKLNGSINDRNIPGGQILNFLLFGGILLLSILL